MLPDMMSRVIKDATELCVNNLLRDAGLVCTRTIYDIANQPIGLEISFVDGGPICNCK